MNSLSAWTGHPSGWPVILLVVVVLTLPCLGMVWLMTRAMENERLAVHQKLAEAYRVDLDRIVSGFEKEWEERFSGLETGESTESPSQIFRRIVVVSECDSAIILNETGEVVYPNRPTIAEFSVEEVGGDSGDWIDSATDLLTLVESATETQPLAVSLQNRAKELLRSGRAEAALLILTETLQHDRLREATAPSGRRIAPDSLLLALKVIDNPTTPRFQTTLDRLRGIVNDYTQPGFPSRQRLHLMEEIEAWVPVAGLPTLAAERLAWTYIESRPPTPQGMGVRPSTVRDLWHCHSSAGKVIGIYREETVFSSFANAARESEAKAGYRVVLEPVQESDGGDPPFLSSTPLGTLPDYRLNLFLIGENPFEEASEKQIAAYRFVAIGVFLITLCLALGVGYLVNRQMRLTRLKNDLIATVSHELKTPLASIRLLVDTLIDGKISEGEATREYLEMIAKENQRLGRLIDNFLTFSRMERNRLAFDSSRIEVSDLLASALETVEDRFHSQGVRFEVVEGESLPPLRGDRDALATAILNLLDNAYKYSEDPREIRIETSNGNGEIVFEVADNGIGIPRRARKKIFDRFYQVDQSLSRKAGGCGLGLAIVDFIVRAHGGRVEAHSEVGVGSRFRIRLPVEKTGSTQA